MDATKLLTSQHRSIEALLQRAMSEKAADNRAAIFALAADELAIHFAAEERLFYPAVKAAGATENIFLNQQEHTQLKHRAADLLTLDLQDQDFFVKLNAYNAQLVLNHRHEEQNLFVNARRLLDHGKLFELASQIWKLQDTMLAHGSPRRLLMHHSLQALDV